ncbi:hypothetical protein D3C80_1194740 [compost metagenome]
MLNASRFRQHLPPAIFQGGLGSQHGQARVRKLRVGVVDLSGKQEVRLVAVLGLCAAGVANSLRLKNGFEVVFQRLTGPGLAAILDT